MQSELQHRFDVIERQRAAIKSSVLALNAAQLNWTPNDKTWSVQRIVEHLVLSDETVGRPQETASLPTEAFMFRVLPRALRFRFILRALRRDVVLPLPAPSIEPHGNIPLSELLSRWKNAREEMRRVLETLHGHEKRNFHPVLGQLTPLQTLELGEVHTAYHLRQMEALQREPTFPKGIAIRREIA